MYYIVTKTYVSQRQDSDTIEIRTSPVITGNHNNCVWKAHGEYATIEEARDAIFSIFGEVRDSHHYGDNFESDEEEVCEIYKRGKYSAMSSQETANWAWDLLQQDIKADTTDDQIADLIAEYEAEVNRYGATLHSDLEDFMKDRRNELRDEG